MPDPSFTAATSQVFGDRSSNPLLHEDNEGFLEDSELSSLYSTFCGSEHANHMHRSRELCYLYYLSKIHSKSALPLVPKTKIPLLSPGILTRGAPLLDHVDVLLKAQSNCRAGGSFRPFIKDSVKMMDGHRQVSLSTSPSTRTIIYGISPTEVVQGFITDFNAIMSKYQNPTEGSFPFEFFHFDVVYCRTSQNFSPQITKSFDSPGRVIAEPMSDIPARVTLGFWEHRFDIVFNYEYSNLDLATFEADFKLIMQKTCLEDIWHKLFSKLKGFAVGINLSKKLDHLFDFLNKCFTYRNSKGLPELNHVDLNVLLVIAGWDYPKLHSPALSFICTGGVILKPWELEYGLGSWNAAKLSKAADIYLQSECYAVLNATMLCSMIWMLHWFVTPGIASLVTRKDPVKFLKWCTNFQVLILKDAFLSSSDLISDLGCRKNDPSSLIFQI